MPQPGDGTPGALAAESRHALGDVPRILIGLLPLWILLVLLVALPAYVYPLGANPPAISGLPVGIVLVAATLVLMAIGVVVLGRTSSAGSTFLAFACLTLPSAIVVLIAPALIRMVLNLGSICPTAR